MTTQHPKRFVLTTAFALIALVELSFVLLGSMM